MKWLLVLVTVMSAILGVSAALTKRETGKNVRLVKPDGMQGNGTGRVEIFHDGRWGSVCDYNWDKKDAEVVCIELGFVKAVHETRKAKYGEGTGPVWIENVSCKGNELSLLDCKHSGFGKTWCNHNRDAGVKCLHEGVPQILEVGCFQDAVTIGSPENRALSDLYLNARSQVDWHNMRSMVTKCAEGAHALGYKYFGVQFFGECWGSKNASLNFDIYGKGAGCYEGVGAESHNFVYRFAPWKDLGCWHDMPDTGRTMTLLNNFRSSIDWFHLEITVKKCYEAAKEAGKSYFAVQFYGECWVGDDESYQKYGYSVNCYKGVGKNWANYVYKVMW